MGWEPIAQWDLSAEEDINHCIYENGTDCEDNLKRGAEVSVMIQQKEMSGLIWVVIQVYNTHM